MDKLKYIIIFFLGYLIFRIVSRYYTTEGFSPSSSNVAIGDDADNGKFILPITEDADNTVQTDGYKGRYVRIMPSVNKGDGYFGLTQIIVYDSNNNNIAFGMPVYGTSVYTGHAPAFTLTSGQTTPQWSPDFWNSATGNRSTEFVEVDLGSLVNISSVRLIGRNGCCTASDPSGNDRTSQMRIQITSTSNSTSAMAFYNDANKANIATTDGNLTNKEVYHIGGSFAKGQAQAQCAKYDGTLATYAQLTGALGAGADWCLPGWLADFNLTNAYYPIVSGRSGCGTGFGVQTFNSVWLPNSDGTDAYKSGKGNASTALAGAVCYGVKPSSGQNASIAPYSSITKEWNAPYIKSSSTTIVAITQPNGTVVPTPCVSTNCLINCNITYSPSGTCVLIPK
jgi:hypothetical protein